jgi:hypothetical protein
MDVAFKTMPQGITDILCNLKAGARVLTYEDILVKWPTTRKTPFPFREMNPGDKYLTTWQPVEGHSFFMWLKVRPPSKPLSKSCGNISHYLKSSRAQSETSSASNISQ